VNTSAPIHRLRAGHLVLHTHHVSTWPTLLFSFSSTYPLAALSRGSSLFAYRPWRRSGWLLVRLAPDTPHKARDGCDPACRRSSTSRGSRKGCCAAADLSGSHATGIPCSKYT